MLPLGAKHAEIGCFQRFFVCCRFNFGDDCALAELRAGVRMKQRQRKERFDFWRLFS
ncbi:MAG: hypothetical protein ACI3XD_03980 [Oscillospiraceae bacterium]